MGTVKAVNNNLLAWRASRKMVAVVWLLLACAGAVPAAEVDAPGQPLQIWSTHHGENQLNVPSLPDHVPDGDLSSLTAKGVQQVTAPTDCLASVPFTALDTSTWVMSEADGTTWQRRNLC